MPVFFYDLPIGQIGIVEEKEAITHILFETDPVPGGMELEETGLMRKAIEQIREYLLGKRTSFNLSVRMKEAGFFRDVWGQLAEIPYGETRTYGQISREMNRQSASRVVGAACGKNPLPILIPCHRVVGKDGALTGYRGGIELKKRLLEMERMTRAGRFILYGHQEVQHLKKKDKRLGMCMERVGLLQRSRVADPFEALIHSVVAQQISGKAAETVWERLKTRMGQITPDILMNQPVEEIQSCGLSHRKVATITGIARAAAEKQVDFETLHLLSDEEVVGQLSGLKGVGAWTAEMLLLFSLHRPDVVSYLDLGIRRGMMNLYGLKDLPEPLFHRYRRRYSPYGSVASLYLWHLAANPQA